MTTASEAVETEERRGPLPPIRESRVMTRERDEDAMSVMEWFNAIAGDNACKLKIDRKLPRTGPNGENISGVLETVDEKVDDIEEYLREVWGGGTFQLQVQLPNGNGGWKFGKAKTIKIAGPCKMNGQIVDGAVQAAAAPTTSSGDSMAGRAIDVSADVAERERQRADRLERQLAEARERGGKADMDAMQALLKPLHDQIDSLREQNLNLQQQLIAQVAKPPPVDSFRDKLLEESVAGESKRLQDQQARYEQRLDRMRDEHAAELRQIREGHNQDMKRLEDRHDRALADLTKAHDRALDAMKETHARELKLVDRSQQGEAKALDVAHQTRVDTLTADRDRLKAEITALKAEVGALRDKKDKSPADQLKEIAGMKKDLDALTGGGDDEGDKPWYERLVGALGNSEVAMRVVDRIGGGGEEDEEEEPEQPQARPQPQQVQVHPPAGTIVRNPEDGGLYVSRGGGMYEGPYTVQQLQAARTRRRRARAVAASTPPAAVAAEGGEQLEGAEGAAIDEGLADEGAEGAPARQEPRSPQVARPNPVQKPRLRQLGAAPAAAPAAPKGKPPKPEDVKLAVTFLENALGRGAKAEDVARAAKSLVPGSTVAYIRSVGVDNFLNAVAESKQGSPLVTQHGRTFVRQVAKLLFEGPS